MIEQTEADTGRRMGRKPLGLTRIPVRLAPDVIERIDALVSTYGRPAFIREAVERELERRENGGDASLQSARKPADLRGRNEG